MPCYTLEEQIISCIARSFSAGDALAVIATSASGEMGLIMAKKLYAPRLSLLGYAGGRYGVLSDIRFPFVPGKMPKETIETLYSTDEAFGMVLSGKYFVIMQPVQIDQHGYMNLSLIGDKRKPTNSFVGSRGVPTNTVVQPRTLYFVPSHTRRVFVENVDFKSGVGMGEERKNGTVKWGAPIEVISNLCVIDFDETTDRARLKSLHSGVTIDEVRENTGFDLIIPDDIPETTIPTEQELHVLRTDIDPLGVRRLDFLKGQEYREVLGEIIGS
jgi:acyl CoA:acetate/3-ketoacid CoA transferase beta subunit